MISAARLLRRLLWLLPLLLPLGAPAQEAYRIQPGDTLRIEVIEDPSLNRSVLVSPDGRITLPLTGSLRAAGRSVEEVQAALVAGLAPNFAATPTVFVGLERLAEPEPLPEAAPEEAAVILVYLMGEVEEPGALELAPGTTLLQGLAQSGGFTRFAATRRLQLRRIDETGVERIYPFDYEAIVAGRSPNGAVVLQAGDVILVPQRRLFE